MRLDDVLARLDHQLERLGRMPQCVLADRGGELGVGAGSHHGDRQAPAAGDRRIDPALEIEQVGGDHLAGFEMFLAHGFSPSRRRGRHVLWCFDDGTPGLAGAAVTDGERDEEARRQDQSNQDDADPEQARRPV
ncbi:MAG: hypothetical protein WDN44_15440 [Sphingomonas sp.]